MSLNAKRIKMLDKQRIDRALSGIWKKRELLRSKIKPLQAQLKPLEQADKRLADAMIKIIDKTIINGIHTK